MNQFLQNAHEIFDVACAGRDAEDVDFTLLVRHDGGLHLLMAGGFGTGPVALEAAAGNAGARVAYRVTRSRGEVKVVGTSAGQTCVLNDRATNSRASYKSLLSDQVLYQVASPLLAAVSS